MLKAFSVLKMNEEVKEKISCSSVQEFAICLYGIVPLVEQNILP